MRDNRTVPTSTHPAPTGSLDERARSWLRDALGLDGDARPFPWQQELLRRLLAGRVDRSIDVPTGLGKTGVMAAWLVARALGADIPRRLVYVVDRRAVVDQATREAERLRAWIAGTPEARAGLGLDAEALLPISTLRGQFVDNREWLEDPARAAIVVGTVDMIGSRLLFEGYATSRKMRPYHAAFLGLDTLVALDEAHLVPPFERLVAAIVDGGAQFGPREPDLRTLLPAPRLMSLSATGRGEGGHSALQLSTDDLADPVVARRIHAPKRLTLEAIDDAKQLPETLAARAWALAEEGAAPVRVVVFANSRDDADKSKAALEKLARGDKKRTDKTGAGDGPQPATELFVGGRRVFERTEAARALEALGFLAGDGRERRAPVFLFCTSAAEVGVDLDADHMVCDLVAWERMVQRLGRVNRRGNGDARVHVLVAPPSSKGAGKGGEEDPRVATVHHAQALVDHLTPLPDGSRDASPAALSDLARRARADADLDAVYRAARTPAPLYPELTRPLVDAWAMTSLREHSGRPEVAPWLRGWVDDEPRTGVVWRTLLPPETATSPELAGFFEAAPPHTSEVLETESSRVASWLEQRAKTLLAAAAKAAAKAATRGSGASLVPGPDDVVAYALGQAGDVAHAWRLSDWGPDVDRRERNARLRAIRQAALVLDARIGGLSDGGLLDPKESAAPRTADDGRPWLAEDSDGSAPAPPVVGFRVRAVSASEGAVVDARWRERFRLPTERTAAGEVARWLVVEKWRHAAATEDDRGAGRPQRLDDHQSWTVGQAHAIADRLRLGSPYADALAIAARLHDTGKRAARWQRAFAAPEGGPYAKTRGPLNVHLLDGYRHELGSLLEAEADPEVRALPEDVRALVLHLVAAHHGFARPLISGRGCEAAPRSALEERTREVTLRFVALQRRWGPWGLAWWESLLRAADQQASRLNDAQEKSR